MFKTMISSIVAKNMKRKLQNATIKEDDISEVLKQIRKNLLEADVNLKVTKEFIANIKKQAVDKVLDPNEKPADALLLIIKNELVNILGKNTELIDYEKKPTKIMLVGLQGSGKTTTAAKLAYFVQKKQKKTPLLVACDIYRLAAIDQLETLSQQINADFYCEKASKEPVQIALNALEYGKSKQDEIYIFDTAGRLHTNVALMNELKNIKRNINPSEILLVVDSMSGQDIINVAKEFHDALNLTGIIITKLDSDTRAGAALSLCSILNVPIKYSGVGEKVSELDIFHPDRIADKILGLGDLVSLAEEASEKMDEKVFKRSLQRMFSGKMDLEDLLSQLEQVSKMGSFSSIVSKLPNADNLISETKINDVEQKIRIWKVLLSSMTLKERRNPGLIKKNQNRRIRIIKGSGRKPEELNKMINEWEKAKQRMDHLGKQLRSGKNPFSGLM